MTFDPSRLDELWDFDDPAGSETRFRQALDRACGDWALVLRTQLARSLGLQRRFNECAAELDAVAAAVPAARPDAEPADDAIAVRVYLELERGRRLRSAGEPERARPHVLAALDLASRAGLDYLAADAAHMLAIIGTNEDQIAWARRGLAIAAASNDRRARQWAGPLANNLGWTLHSMGRQREAQEQFEAALVAYQERGEAERIRVARWTVARGLRSLGRHEEALTVQEELARTGPEDGYVCEELGELLLALGRGEEAKAHFARAHSLLSADAGLAEAEPQRLDRLRRLAG